MNHRWWCTKSIDLLKVMISWKSWTLKVVVHCRWWCTAENWEKDHLLTISGQLMGGRVYYRSTRNFSLSFTSHQVSGWNKSTYLDHFNDKKKSQDMLDILCGGGILVWGKAKSIFIFPNCEQRSGLFAQLSVICYPFICYLMPPWPFCGRCDVV